jgi:hypothetical protein
MSEPGHRSFDAKTISDIIVKALGLKPDDDLELQRDRLNPNRILVIRHPRDEVVPNVQGSG